MPFQIRPGKKGSQSALASNAWHCVFNVRVKVFDPDVHHVETDLETRAAHTTGGGLASRPGLESQTSRISRSLDTYAGSHVRRGLLFSVLRNAFEFRSCII